VLLTRAPLYSSPEGDFRVRLACVRHAASVDSEPGSNSQSCFLVFLVTGLLKSHPLTDRKLRHPTTLRTLQPETSAAPSPSVLNKDTLYLVFKHRSGEPALVGTPTFVGGLPPRSLGGHSLGNSEDQSAEVASWRWQECRDQNLIIRRKISLSI
jgi:hypothetical protein